MHTPSTTSRARRAPSSVSVAALAVAALAFVPSGARAQLTLTAALSAARQTSPELRAAREAVTAAAARERQAGAFANPTLAYAREQTSREGRTNAQDIAQIEQPLDIGGQRSARRDAARLRRLVAEARLDAAAARLDFEVRRAFALAIAADRRARIAEHTAGSFIDAQRVSERRLAAGDESGYSARRLRLEAARYAAVRASARLERRATRVALASLMGTPATGADSLALPPGHPTEPGEMEERPSLEPLLARAERSRADLRIATLEAEATAADGRLATRERVPTPTLSAGYKGERVADPASGSRTGFRGLVAGVSVPLPLFDRRAGAVEAASAETRRAVAEVEVIRRRVSREVADALDALRAAESQRDALAPHLGEGAQIAVRAVQTSYAEGEITLVEWLDAVRAYQDAESTYVTLQADVAIARAALVRAVGAAPAVTTSLER